MSDFDLRVISLGAGVQSSALYRLAVMEEVGPKPDYAIFADTHQEPKWVYETLDELERWGDIPIRRPSAGDLGQAIERSIEDDGDRFASVPFWVSGKDGNEAPMRRQCTREFKIDVVRKDVRTLLGLEPGQVAVGKYQIEEWVGISTDEAHRAKPARHKWVTTRWPLLYDRPMNRTQIKEWMAANHFAIPGKSACVFCPYRTALNYAEWRRDHPELFEEACNWDDLLRSKGNLRRMDSPSYIWRELKPLRELPPIEELDGRDQLDLFGNECEGMCGV